MRQSSTRYLGMDVHQDTRAVAYVAQDHDAEVVDLGTIGTRPSDCAPPLRTLPSKAQPLVVVDEAGPCGAWRSRDLTHTRPARLGRRPVLHAPNRRATASTTDRRDAVPRARLMRSGALTPVSVPAVEDDAIRDRRRAREDAIGALKAAKFRLKPCAPAR